MTALTLFETGTWQVRSHTDAAANALADRHYSRRRRFSGRVGGPWHTLVFVTPCERAFWLTTWTNRPMDGLDAWRCAMFRNEGAGLASDLIRDAMVLTNELWRDRVPAADGWVTWIDARRIASAHPGYCFKQAGWTLDRAWSHPYLVRLRAELLPE